MVKLLKNKLSNAAIGFVYGIRIWNLILIHIPVVLTSFVILNFYSLTKSLLIVLIISLVAGSGYLFNNYIDASLDRLANKLSNPLTTNILSKNSSLTFFIIMNMTAILMNLLFLEEKMRSLLVLLIIISLGNVYSIYFKRKPFIDFFAYSIAASLVPIYVSIGTTSKLTEDIIYYSLFLLFINMGGHISAQIRDLQSDKNYGIKTTAIVLGYQRSLLLSFIFSIFSSLFIFKIINKLSKFFFSISLLIIILCLFLIYIYGYKVNIKKATNYLKILIFIVNIITILSRLV